MNNGHTAKGTYNFISTQPSKYPVLTQVEGEDELGNTDVPFPDFEDTLAYYGQDDTDTRLQPIEDDDANVERNKPMLQRRVIAITRNKEEKEPKRQKKSVGVEGLTEMYFDMRSKQAEDEVAQLAREKEAHLVA
ncbi:hypothetical protein E2562_009737 [Oryza meyeriana var. granulata]|uniref:Uncharacterized protein n=1 Tax=Oryza meyeriana var. granulata TaxID=110450 RepID=A0A6G1D212_9ORYZ|nr:hypothetical protein E2562_009737 [Oryza meyeriana var. granulata]